MAKKKKNPPHVQALLHRDITEQVITMIGRAEWLRDHDRIDEARRLLTRIEKLTQELKELEK
jgi:hypothetical protein